MTSREKRYWRDQGIDWRQVVREREAADVVDVSYEIDGGKPVMPDDPAEQAIVLCAAAIDQVLRGRLTGRVSVPRCVWDRCQKEVVKWAMG